MGVFGQKKPASGRIGLKKQAHSMMRLGLKASNIALGAGAVAALAGPEALPVASALEAAGGIGKAVFGLGSQVV
jgi:hypothetical protein